jgi:hypothetical protein
MSLYDLNKDMLIKLITIIREETIRECREVEKISDNEAIMLYHTRCHNFYKEQEDRFELIEDIEYPENVFNETHSLFWCPSEIAAIMFKKHKISKGYKVILLYDTDHRECVVLTNEKFRNNYD